MSSPRGFAKSSAVLTKSIYPFPRRSPECALGSILSKQLLAKRSGRSSRFQAPVSSCEGDGSSSVQNRVYRIAARRHSFHCEFIPERYCVALCSCVCCVHGKHRGCVCNQAHPHALREGQTCRGAGTQ